jgi:hypothetical protein
MSAIVADNSFGFRLISMVRIRCSRLFRPKGHIAGFAESVPIAALLLTFLSRQAERFRRMLAI